MNAPSPGDDLVYGQHAVAVVMERAADRILETARRSKTHAAIGTLVYNRLSAPFSSTPPRAFSAAIWMSRVTLSFLGVKSWVKSLMNSKNFWSPKLWRRMWKAYGPLL